MKNGKKHLKWNMGHFENRQICVHHTRCQVENGQWNIESAQDMSYSYFEIE